MKKFEHVRDVEYNYLYHIRPMRKGMIMFVFCILLISLVSAVETYTSSYETNSTHMGISGSNISTASYVARDTITHQQATTRIVETLSYTANSGWFDVISIFGIAHINEVLFSNESTFNYMSMFNESNIDYEMNITYIAVNCSASVGEVENVTFDLYNEEDEVSYIEDAGYTFKQGDLYVLNTSYEIRDSGNWTLSVYCSISDEGAVKLDESLWEIAWGVIAIEWISPIVDTSVELYEFFTIEANITCSDAECGTINVTLDPEEVSCEEVLSCVNISVGEECVNEIVESCDESCSVVEEEVCEEVVTDECLEYEVVNESETDECLEFVVEENCTIVEEACEVSCSEEVVESCEEVVEENCSVESVCSVEEVPGESGSGSGGSVGDETLVNETIVEPMEIVLNVSDMIATVVFDENVTVIESDLVMPKVDNLTTFSIMAVEEKEFEYITPILAVELESESGAVVVLPKNSDSGLEVIVKCAEWNFNESECDSEWYVYATVDEIEQDDVNVWFDVDSFSAYVGGNLTDGETAFLVVWDENDVGMDGAAQNTSVLKSINENVTFFADYKIAKNGTKISDGECNITIDGSEYSMTYDGSEYYNYTINMTVAGSYDYMIDCTHSTYTDLNVNDTIMVEGYSGQSKGAVSTVEGDTPFYTTSLNPQECALRKGETCNVTWEVNSTGVIDKIYDFFIEAFGFVSPGGITRNVSGYVNSSHLNMEITSDDVTSPVIQYATGTSSVSINGTDVILNANVWDNMQVDSVWVNVTKPDESSTLHYLLPYTYTDTASTGTYDLIFYANDTSGNNDTYSTSFEVVEGINFNFSINLAEEVHIILVDPDSNEVIHENTTNTSYSVELPDILYDASFDFESDNIFNITISDFNLSANNGESISGEEHNDISGYLMTYGVDTDYSFTSATVILGYDDLSYTTEGDLRLWLCADYDFDGQSCSGSFVEITSSATQNTAGDYFEYVASSFSAFSIDEDTSTDDGDTDDGSSGGGSSGGGGAATTTAVTTTTNVTETPVEEEGETELPEQLFDIRMDLEETLIGNSNELEAVITFASFGTVPTLVDLIYVILDADGVEVHRESSEVTVTTEEVVRKTFENLNLPDGKYTFVFSSLYDVDVYDEYTSEFTVGGEEEKSLMWLWISLVIILTGALVWWLVKRKNKKL